MPHDLNQSLNLDPKDPVAAPGQVTGNLRNCDETEADNSESRDAVPELAIPAPSRKGRRLRSKKESRSSKGASFFAPFKRRKRSHTLRKWVGAKKRRSRKM